MDLNAGIKLERALYYSSFSLEDRKEGMAAFVQKRDPVFNDKWDGSVGVEAKRGQRRTNSLHTLNWFSLDKDKFVEEHDSQHHLCIYLPFNLDQFKNSANEHIDFFCSLFRDHRLSSILGIRKKQAALKASQSIH